MSGVFHSSDRRRQGRGDVCNTLFLQLPAPGIEGCVTDLFFSISLMYPLIMNLICPEKSLSPSFCHFFNFFYGFVFEDNCFLCGFHIFITSWLSYMFLFICQNPLDLFNFIQ